MLWWSAIKQDVRRHEGISDKGQLLTRRNGYDLTIAADRRDLARAMLTEIVGWQKTHRYENAVASDFLLPLAGQHAWTVHALALEIFLRDLEREWAGDLKHSILGYRR